MMKKYRNGLFWRRIGKCPVQIVPPELHPQCANSRIRDQIGYPGELDIKCSYGKVGISGRWRYEGLKSK